MWREFQRKQPINTRYRDDRNEKHALKTVLEQVHVLKRNNLATNIAENLQNSFNIYSNIHSFIM